MKFILYSDKTFNFDPIIKFKMEQTTCFTDEKIKDKLQFP